MKKPFYVLAIFILLVLSLISYSYIEHDIKLNQAKISFATLQHPTNTTFVKRVSQFGKLNGNGVHCDYFVGELRSFKGDRHTLYPFYQDKKVWSPIEQKYLQILQLTVLKNGQIVDDGIEALPYTFRNTNSWGIDEKISKSQLYIVFVLDGGTANEGCDFRCF